MYTDWRFLMKLLGILIFLHRLQGLIKFFFFFFFLVWFLSLVALILTGLMGLELKIFFSA